MKLLYISFFLILVLLIPSLVLSQDNSVNVLKSIDSMTDEISYTVDSSLVIYSEDETSGFGLSPFIDNFKVEHIIVRFVGLGNCSEGDELILLFEDGSRIIKKSWSDFGCDGSSFFRVSESDYSTLKEHRISRIRFTNGRTYDSLTGEVSESYKDYFISVINQLENRNFTEVVD